MNSQSTNIGSVVMLNSGSFAMTVLSIDKAAGTALCCWENEKKGILEQQEFPLDALTEHVNLPIDTAKILALLNEEDPTKSE